MTDNSKALLVRIVAQKVTDKTKANAIKADYKTKYKAKALTAEERLDRLEKLVGIQ